MNRGVRGQKSHSLTAPSCAHAAPPPHHRSAVAPWPALPQPPDTAPTHPRGTAPPSPPRARPRSVTPPPRGHDAEGRRAPCPCCPWTRPRRRTRSRTSAYAAAHRARPRPAAPSACFRCCSSRCGRRSTGVPCTTAPPGWPPPTPGGCWPGSSSPTWVRSPPRASVRARSPSGCRPACWWPLRSPRAPRTMCCPRASAPTRSPSGSCCAKASHCPGPLPRSPCTPWSERWRRPCWY